MHIIIKGLSSKVITEVKTDHVLIPSVEDVCFKFKMLKCIT